MKTIAPKRQKSITLKEYMHNASLRKRVSSRASSKQKRQLPLKLTDAHFMGGSVSKLERDRLIEDIKLTLAKVVASQVALAQILKMLARLVQLYNSEIYDKQCQYGLLETMIQEGSSTKITQSKRIDETNYKMKTLETLNASSQHQQNTRKNSIEIHHYRNPSNTSSEDIPNINVLLMTRNEPLFDRIQDQQTKETLIDHSFASPMDDQSRISIEINQTKDGQTSFINNSRISSSPRNQLMKSVNKEPIYNGSAHSIFWKKNSNEHNNILSKFEDLRRKINR